MSGKIKKGLFILCISSSLFSYNMTFANIRIKEVEIKQELLDKNIVEKKTNLSIINQKYNENNIDIITTGLLEHKTNHQKIALLDFNHVNKDLINRMVNIDEISSLKKNKDLYKFSLNNDSKMNLLLDYKLSYAFDFMDKKIEELNLKENKSNIFINDLKESAMTQEELNKYTVLTLEKLLNKEEFFKDSESLNKSEKIKEIIKIQKLSEYISENYDLPLRESENIVYSVYLESNKKDLEPLLVLSIISIESTFRKKARSHVGAVGLTQVMEKVHKKRILHNKVDIWSISGNIKIGTDILHEYLGLAKGNMKRALQMYNGSSKDKSYKYSNKVLKKLDDFTIAYNDK